MRYAHHVLEPVTIMIGTNIKYIRAISSSKKNQILQIKYKNNINVILNFHQIITILNQLFSKKQETS